MKKDKRLVYLELAFEACGTICNWCKYKTGSCNQECAHPLGEELPWDYSYGIEPGDDCWAFRPDMPVADIADIVGIIIANGWVEWDYTKEPLTVSGSK